jgi:hypothetical protein
MGCAEPSWSRSRHRAPSRSTSFVFVCFWVLEFVCWVVLVCVCVCGREGGRERSWNDGIVGRRGVPIPLSGSCTQEEARVRIVLGLPTVFA